MSVTFSPYDPERQRLGENYVNLSNANARTFLEWMHLPGHELDQPTGIKEVSWVRRRCMIRCWRVKRNEDPGQAAMVHQEPGRARLIELGREPGYLQRKAQELLGLCHIAEVQGYSHISWG